MIKQDYPRRLLEDGTVRTEIYVMLALSSASYVLPERRPWDPRCGTWRAERQEKMEREDKERADARTPENLPPRRLFQRPQFLLPHFTTHAALLGLHPRP